MKILLILLPIVVGIVAAVATVVVVGAFMPRGHRATRSAHFAAAPQVVWGVITDFPSHPTWRKDVKTIEPRPGRDGKAVWQEEGGFRPMLLEVSEFDPPRRMVTTILNTDLPFGGQWTYELAPESGGTRLRITEDGVIHAAAFRYLSRVFGQASTIQQYLRALSKRLGESPVIEE